MKLKAILQCRRQNLMFYSFFAVLSYVRAAMHRITSLELLGTLIAGLEQKSKLINLRPPHAKNLLLQ